MNSLAVSINLAYTRLIFQTLATSGITITLPLNRIFPTPLAAYSATKRNSTSRMASQRPREARLTLSKCRPIKKRQTTRVCTRRTPRRSWPKRSEIVRKMAQLATKTRIYAHTRRSSPSCSSSRARSTTAFGSSTRSTWALRSLICRRNCRRHNRNSGGTTRRYSRLNRLRPQ